MNSGIASSWYAAIGSTPAVRSLVLAGEPVVDSAAAVGPLPLAALLGTDTESISSAGVPFAASDFRLPRIAVRSYYFTPRADEKAVATAKDPAVVAPAIAESNARRASRRYTRVAPPEDVVGLADRLSMLLEPPLELLLNRSSLEFPAQPFPFQMQGVAFLYPRQAALLADEMGLGKTMQAITAVRLLVHTREVRHVLFVCPKPLVTNWQREFSFWAPELPVLVIEGDRAKRRWQWRQNDAPVVVANYEILRRDADIVNDPSLHFDLMVLDESQRIKNRSGTTA